MILWETDWRDPVGAFAPFAGVAHAHLLHGGDRSAMAEWSIIAAFPSSVIASKDAGGNPFASIDEALRERRRARGDLPADIPFASGALGFVGYEAAQAFEPSLSLSPSPFSFPDMTLGFYDAAALFSRTKREAFIAGREESAGDRRAACARRCLLRSRDVKFYTRDLLCGSCGNHRGHSRWRILSGKPLAAITLRIAVSS